MKKTLSLLIAAIMLCSVFAVLACGTAFAQTASFAQTFFPNNGKIGTIAEIYYQVSLYNDKPTTIYMWLTHAEDFWAMLDSHNQSEDPDVWFQTYNLRNLSYYVQLDCKLDNGNYQYKQEWDELDYPNDDFPSYAYYPNVSPNYLQKTGRVEGSVLSSDGAEGEFGFLDALIKGNGSDGYYLDLANHSVTLRARYVVKYETLDQDQAFYLRSDWSQEIVLGKNATQVDLVKPEKVDAPIISNLQFSNAEIDADGIVVSTWKVNVSFSDSTLAADKYYLIEMDEHEPLEAKLEYRVYKDGAWEKWQNTTWANPQWLTTGIKEFFVKGASQDDAIEFRVRILNNAESSKNSPYSESIIINADKAGEGPSTPPSGINDPADGSTTPTPKTKCKLCGFCPVQPLGICLLIWIAAIVVIAIVVIIVKKKINKDKDEKEE